MTCDYVAIPNTCLAKKDCTNKMKKGIWCISIGGMAIIKEVCSRCQKTYEFNVTFKKTIYGILGWEREYTRNCL